MGGCCGNCCSWQRCGSFYLAFLNGLLCVWGLSLIALSIYLRTSFSLGELVSDALIWAPLGCGILVLGLGVLGCVSGQLHKKRCPLVCYTIALVVVLILSLTLAVFLLVSVAHMSSVADTKDAASLTAPAVQDVVVFESATYNACCAKREGSLYTVSLCPCAAPTQQGCLCFSNKPTYDYMAATFDQSSCKYLESLTVMVDGQRSTIVGAPAQGGCGGGDPRMFTQQLYAYAHDTISPVAWGIVCVSGLLVVGVVVSFYLVCCWHRAGKHEHAEEESPPLARGDGEDQAHVEDGEDLHLSRPVDTGDVELQQRQQQGRLQLA
jgi:hypothetical protein